LSEGITNWEEVEPLTEEELNELARWRGEQLETLGWDLLAPHEQMQIRLCRTIDVLFEEDSEEPTRFHRYVGAAAFGILFFCFLVVANQAVRALWAYAT